MGIANNQIHMPKSMQKHFEMRENCRQTTCSIFQRLAGNQQGYIATINCRSLLGRTIYQEGSNLTINPSFPIIIQKTSYTRFLPWKSTCVLHVSYSDLNIHKNFKCWALFSIDPRLFLKNRDFY